ncbi:isoleucyl-tRNA synthetase [Peniophora sp. CONT]|nr:isoleucyl-tRNA synthetase [Peniophora sp. CONT]
MALFRPKLIWARSASTEANKAFSKTLLLPRTSFPQWTDPNKTEKALRDKTCDALYRWQRENVKGDKFVLHDGPPYANGDLHMGHALNKIIKDIINRYQLSMGRNVHYVPGWDCHGLPIENKALQSVEDPSSLSIPDLRSLAQQTAQTAVSSQKSQFCTLGILADWDSQQDTYRTLDFSYELRQLRVFRSMLSQGLINRAFRPVHYSPSSKSALAEAELVYKDDHVSHAAFVAFRMNAPELVAGLTDVEGTEGGEVRALVWTTTPWTLSANMALAVNSDMEYALIRAPQADTAYLVATARIPEAARVLGFSTDTLHTLRTLPGSALVGLKYSPLFSGLEGADKTEKSIIEADFVGDDSGTGIVHLAPAHGHEDYKALPTARGDSLICHVGAGGLYTSKLTSTLGPSAQHLVGQPVLGAGARGMVDLLREGVKGALIKVERYRHRYFYDWKTGEPVIVSATSQWFANLDGVKERALEAIKDVKFLPEQSRRRLEAFVSGRDEWCISRQRAWGVPIPALTHVPSGEVILTPESMDHIISVLEEHGTSHWFTAPASTFVPPTLLSDPKYAEGSWIKSTDTLDVWFDSGSSWAMLPAREDGKPRADVCVEGSDQHRGWFQSQLLTYVGSGAAKEDGKGAPYGALLTHGMVLDEKGVKMSKSKGNVVDFGKIVAGGADRRKDPAYGADALRLWAATVEYGRDMAIGRTAMKQAGEALRKVRNTLRFALGNIGSADSKEVSKEELGLAERYVMHRTWELERTALEGYEAYNFAKVVNALTTYTTTTLSALYFDITKDALYASAPTSLERRRAVTVCRAVLKTLTRVCAPVTPFLAEEAYWHAQRALAPPTSQPHSDSDEELGTTGKSLFEETWTPLSEQEWKDESAAREMGALLKVRGSVLGLLERARRDKYMNGSLEAEVDVVIPAKEGGKVGELLRREEHTLKTLFIVSDANVVGECAIDADKEAYDWLYTENVEVDGVNVGLRLRPARRDKCPRCWTYTREKEERLCERCEGVLGELEAHSQ